MLLWDGSPLEVGTGTTGGGNGIPTGTVVFRAPSGFRATFTAVPRTGYAYTSPAGMNADLVSHSDNTYQLKYRSNGQDLRFTPGGFLTWDGDRNGNALRYAYNGDDTLASVTDAVGRVTTFDYSPDHVGKISQITDPAGRTVGFAYDGSDRLSRVTDARSKVSSYEYDSAGRLQYVTTYGGSVTKVGYDTSNRVTSLTRYLARGTTSGASAVTSFAYAAGSTTVTDANAHSSTFTLDSSGRATKAVDALGHTRSTSWTSNSDVATSTDAMGATAAAGNVSTYAYDSSNNPVSVAAPTGATARATYATGGTCGSSDSAHPYQAKCTTDAGGNQAAYTYDGPGNVLSVKDTTTGGTGVTTTFTYQGTAGVACGGRPGQKCSARNGKGAVTSFSYDGDGNLTTVTPPAPVPPSTYGYDSIGRLTSSIDGKGQHVTYGYDAADHLTLSDYADSQFQTFFTDDGYPYANSDPINASLGVMYDALNRQVARTASNTSATLSVTLDGVGNTLTSIDPSGTTKYGYDAANRLTWVAQPGGSCPATGPGTKCTRFGYDSNNAQTTITYPGPTTQATTRDTAGRPTRIVTSSTTGGVLSDQSYSYLEPGMTGTAGDRDQLQARTFNAAVPIAQVPAAAVQTYTYDSLRRLSSDVERTSTGTVNTSWAYLYDQAGNRTQITRAGHTGSTTGVTTYGYNAADELTAINGATTGLGYDANGNETASPPTTTFVPARTSTLNLRDQVTSTTVTKSGAQTTLGFGFAGATNTTRTGITTTLGAGGTPTTTNLLTGPVGVQVTEDGASSGAATSYTRTPNGTLLARTTPDGASSYYGTDYQGNVTVLVDAAGAQIAQYVYDPTGAVRTYAGVAATANSYRFGGAYGATTDTPTGLVKLGARYLDPSTGRFTQPDPSGQEPNTYLYAGSDPINNTDPTGTCTTQEYIVQGSIIVGSALGFVGGLLTSEVVVGNFIAVGSAVIGFGSIYYLAACS